MLKYKILYGIMLLFAAAVFVMANSAAALLLLILMILLPIIIKLSVMDNSSKIKISCRMSDVCVIGSTSKPLVVKIENKSILPMGNIDISLRYMNHMFGTEYVEHVSLCGARGQSEFEIPVNTDKCGRSEIMIGEVYCGDVLNILKSKIDFHWKKTFTVYPKLTDMQLHTKKLLSAEFGGQNYDRSRRGNDNSEVFQVRDYENGDNLSAAHWKLSAKLGELVIRDWSRPNNFRLIIIFDLMSEDASGEKVSIEEISAMIGFTASVSRALAYQLIGHNTAMFNCGEILEMSVDKPSDSGILLDEMMSIVVPKSNNTLFDEIISNDIQDQYSKLVYIGPKANAEMLKGLSAYMDVTLLAVTEGGKTTYEQDMGCSVYTIPTKEIESGLDFIEL